MDETCTVTSHLKHRPANYGATWNSHCKRNTLGPILPCPALEMMLDMPGAFFGACPENTCTKPAGQGLQAWGAGRDLHKLGFGQGAPRDKALSQLGGCGAEQEGKPSVQSCKAQLKQDFSKIHGVFNASISPQTGNASLSQGSSVLLADHGCCCSFASSFPSSDSVHVQNSVPPRLRTTFHTLSQVKSRG